MRGGGQSNLSFRSAKEEYVEYHSLLTSLNSQKKFVAFTLAEVLITLGIIGVVAAMTLPALINNYQAVVLQTQLKKQYSIITNVIQKMNYDLGGMQISDFGYHQFMPLFKQYLNIVKDCNNWGCEEEGITTDDGVVRISNNYKTYNNNNLQNELLDDGQAIVTDGTLYLIENFGREGSVLFISVDINGIYKKPNRWGHDLFTFQVLDNGKVLPMGADGTRYNESYCSTTSTNIINGIGCTHKAVTEKDYFKNLPK